MDVLEMHLEGKPLEYWQIKRKQCEDANLIEALHCLKMNYKCSKSNGDL
jgi:hypothetical protein